MAKTSGTIDLKSMKRAAQGAVDYITDIDNNGIFVHEKSSSAVTPTSSNANGVKIASNVDIIRGGKSVAQYGTNARIGEADKGRLIVTNSDITVYGIKNEEALSFGSTNNATNGSSIVTEYLQIFEQEDNGNTIFGAMTSYKISTILHCYKNGDETLPITMNIDEGVEQDYVYTNTGLSQYDYIEIQYRTNSQISYFKIGNTSSSSGGNSFAMGNWCESHGANSLAIGDYSKAYGKNSVSLGNNNKTMAENSFSVGQNNIVKGEASAATGDGNTINEVAWFSFAAGGDNTITDSCGIALGTENTSSGFASIATGMGTIASGQSSFTCGSYNLQNSNVSFAVGNGTDSTDRSDAFWVSNVGNIGFTGIAYAGQPTGADRVPLFATGTGTAEITINAGATSPTAQSINIAKTGYTPWAINGIDITSPYCNLYRYFIDGNKLYYRLYNTSSSSVTVTITARISYIATSALYTS